MIMRKGATSAGLWKDLHKWMKCDVDSMHIEELLEERSDHREEDGILQPVPDLLTTSFFKDVHAVFDQLAAEVLDVVLLVDDLLEVKMHWRWTFLLESVHIDIRQG